MYKDAEDSEREREKETENLDIRGSGGDRTKNSSNYSFTRLVVIKEADSS